MGKFKTEEFTATSKAGEKFRKKIDFFINSQGEFYFKPDEAFLLNGRPLLKEHNCFYGKNGNFFSNDYGRLCGLIRNTIKKILEVEVKEELIIAYYFFFHGSYFLGRDKEIYTNGYMAGASGSDYDHIGRWVENENTNSHFDKQNQFELQIFARVALKTTYTNSALTKIVYSDPELREGNPNLIGKDDNPSWGEKLNSFNGMTCDERWFRSHSCKEVPYTEERAKYFYEILIGLCTLNERLKTLNNPEFLLKMIAQNNNLLTM